MVSGNGENDERRSIVGNGRTMPVFPQTSPTASSFYNHSHYHQQQSTPQNSKVTNLDSLSNEDILKLISMNPSLISSVADILEKEVETKRLYLQAKANSMLEINLPTTTTSHISLKASSDSTRQQIGRIVTVSTPPATPQAAVYSTIPCTLSSNVADVASLSQLHVLPFAPLQFLRSEPLMPPESPSGNKPFDFAATSSRTPAGVSPMRKIQEYNVQTAITQTQSLKQESEKVSPNIVSFELLSDLPRSKTKMESSSSQSSSSSPSANSVWEKSSPDQTSLCRRRNRFDDSKTNLLLAGDLKLTSERIESSLSSSTSAGTVSLSWPKKMRSQDQHGGQKEEYVDQPSDLDVISGRGGFSNHHPGNKRYRQVIKDMKSQYKNIVSKSEKTDLSRSIVNYVYSYGGRFLRRVELYDDDINDVEADNHHNHTHHLGQTTKTTTTITNTNNDNSTTHKRSTVIRYYIMTPSEARRKTSQSLREKLELKWTTVGP